MGIFSFFRDTKSEIKDRVVFTDAMVKRTRSNGVEESIRWDALVEVGILTTDDGPLQEDVFFLLIASGDKTGVVVSQSCEGCDELLERLQQLPGFDNEAFIRAMGSTSNAKFVCWKRQAD